MRGQPTETVTDGGRLGVSWGVGNQRGRQAGDCLVSQGEMGDHSVRAVVRVSLPCRGNILTRSSLQCYIVIC